MQFTIRNIGHNPGASGSLVGDRAYIGGRDWCSFAQVDISMIEEEEDIAKLDSLMQSSILEMLRGNTGKVDPDAGIPLINEVLWKARREMYPGKSDQEIMEAEMQAFVDFVTGNAGDVKLSKCDDLSSHIDAEVIIK